MYEFEWIDEPAALQTLLKRLRDVPWYGLDTEFHREKTYFAHLALLQVSWPDGIALVDPLATSVAPLRQLLEQDTVAVIHAAEQDLEILERECGALPQRLFDPQIAGLFLGMGTAALGKLVKSFLGRPMDKGSQLADWTHRPLRNAELQYAAADVAHLGALYEALRTELDNVGRLDWATEEMEGWRMRDRSLPDPEQTWWKLRGKARLSGEAMGVAQSLSAWRERIGREKDRPPRHILPDVALLSLAQKRPKRKEDLRRVRGLDRRHFSLSADILKTIAQGAALSRDEIRLPPKGRDDKSIQPTASVCLAWIAQRAEEEAIDASVLGTRNDVVRLIVGEPTRLDTGWRNELIGRDLLALVNGDKSLVVDKGQRLLLVDR